MKTKSSLLVSITVILLAALPMRAQFVRFSVFAGATNAIGASDGVGPAALFNHPRGLAVDAAGNVYVADTGNSAIRLITPDGAVTTLPLQTLAPVQPADVKDILPGPFYIPFSPPSPQAMTLDSNTNLYVSDNLNNVVYKAQTGSWIVTLAAGASNFFSAGFIEQPGLIFNQPGGLAIDGNSNLYVADTYNQVIRQVSPSGTVTTLAGQLGVPGIANGAGTNAQFSFPGGLALGLSNTLYETDLNYGGVRQINSNVASNFWFEPQYGFPRAIATDPCGNIYVIAWVYGNLPQVVQITPQGASNVLGTLPTTGTISAIAVDANTNIYLVDQQNSVIIKSAPYPKFFDHQAALGNGDYYLAFAQGTNSAPFGYYNLDDFPFPTFYHYDLGFEVFMDAHDAQNGAYLYDYASSNYWYTSPQVFPYLYDFTLNSWLYYYPSTNQPGHYTSNPRYFFNFAQGIVITK